MEIKIEKPNEEQIMEAKKWSLWEKEPGAFPWEYSEQEQFLVLEGKATVKPDEGVEVSFGEGDFVTMPKGLRCWWKIEEKIAKLYRFGQ